MPGRYDWLDALDVGQQQIWPWVETVETLDAYRLRIAALKRAVNAYKQRTGKKFRWSPWYQVVPLLVDGRQGSQIIGKGTRVTRIL